MPLHWRDIATTDLSSLNLLYCNPPPPFTFSVGTVGETSVTFNWSLVPDASKYRVEYRSTFTNGWVVDDDTLTGTSHTVDRLTCGTTFLFWMRAYGSGTTYAADWSHPSLTLSETTTECLTPVFDEESYAYELLARNAGVGTVVGTVTAVDPNDDTVTYSITGGNEVNKFRIGGSTGAITVAGAFTDTSVDSYVLTVQASDGTNTGTATVEIAVLHPAISLVDIPESMVKRDLAHFTVRADNLDPSLSYRVTLTRSGTGIVFHNMECGYTAQEVTIPTGDTSYARSFPLHACDTPGGTVTATLLQGETTVATATQAVSVTEPTTPRLPSIEILGLESSMQEGARDGFVVRTFYLDLAQSYSVRVTTDSANLGFDAGCADRQRDVPGRPRPPGRGTGGLGRRGHGTGDGGGGALGRTEWLDMARRTVRGRRRLDTSDPQGSAP